jgi:UDPglucose 6-dehydrogenase
MSKIAVVGLQHQGIILAAGFASVGHEVVGIDDDARKIEFLNKGKSCLLEEGLDELIAADFLKGTLSFSTSLSRNVATADFIFLSIDIPFNESGVDVELIKKTAQYIEFNKKSGTVLCVTSQVPVGTTEMLTGGPVVYIPEFLIPGQSLRNFLSPDRVVIGSHNDLILDQIEHLYKSLWPGVVNVPIFRMSLRSAEMTKHAHNAILATQISFANEIANLCKQTRADIKDVMRGVKMDNRVGLTSYLNPGWTLRKGHLIRDVRVLRGLRGSSEDTPLLDAVLKVDNGMPQ